MKEHVASLLSGAVAMASLLASLFFTKFWRRTQDSFFLFFAAAFAVDAAARFVLPTVQISDETEAVFYVPRLFTFVLILIGIIRKNAKP
jgi:hypothetical protein